VPLGVRYNIKMKAPLRCFVGLLKTTCHRTGTIQHTVGVFLYQIGIKRSFKQILESPGTLLGKLNHPGGQCLMPERAPDNSKKIFLRAMPVQASYDALFD